MNCVIYDMLCQACHNSTSDPLGSPLALKLTNSPFDALRLLRAGGLTPLVPHRNFYFPYTLS